MFAGTALALHELFKFGNDLKVRLANVGSWKGAMNLYQGFSTVSWNTVENHNDFKDCIDFEVF